jgi:hypothetical protein
MTTEQTTTDSTTTPEIDANTNVPAALPAEATSPASPETPTDAPTDDEGKNPNAEAAKYRRQLRETQTANETLSGHVTELQAEVVRLMLTDRMNNTIDFDKFIGIANVLGDDGKIDPEKLETSVTELLTERPYLAPAKIMPRMRPKVAEGQKTASAPSQTAKSIADKFGSSDAKWTDLLNRQGEHVENTRAGTKRVQSELNQRDSS